MEAAASETLRDDGEVVLSRRGDGRASLLTLAVTARHPPRGVVARLQHEYALRDELDAAWAVRPIALLDENGRPALTFEDPGGRPLSDLLGMPLDIAVVLRVAIGTAASLARAHERGLVHRDLKPANILWDADTGRAWLMGFGVASRLPRERRPLDPPQLLEGTLAYMSPEQTGRMNRSVDSRSDLYSLGVALHEVLTGELPFQASDPVEWIYCHIARQAPSVLERRADAPVQVAAIVSKLLEKPAEHRYQTAAGLETDLRHCLEALTTRGQINSFPLGTVDVCTRLVIPERLYGRERDIETLLGSFERVARGKGLEVVLVSGYSGIGKSSVVNELHKALALSRGLLASGKFDRYKRDVPYASLAQAFATLVRHVLAQTEEELGRWRLALTNALGGNGKVITDVVPELEFVIGPQTPVPDLSPVEAQRRFHTTFRQFLAVFAQREHPLVLFLDDLQWLDAATLRLVGSLVSDREGLSLLLIGAFRDNEVHAAHPLMPAIEAIRASGARVSEVRLAALTPEQVGELVADALHGERSNASTLATLVHGKTEGNPFFAIEFLKDLAHEKHVVFDPKNGAWTWNAARILAKEQTGNVLDLMATKLMRLGRDTQMLLREISCLGNSAASSILSLVHGCSIAEVDAVLWDARRAGLLVATSGKYAFVHDRIQEAAYSQIPEAERNALHLRIGRLLLSRLDASAPAEDVFVVVSQLNRVIDLVTEIEERTVLRQLNTKAGKRAKGAVAYAHARDFLSVAARLSPWDAWITDYVETFDLYLTLAECEFLAGDFSVSDTSFATILAHARSDVDRASAHCVRLQLYQLAGRYEEGFTRTCEVLRRFNVELPEASAEIAEATEAEYQRVLLLLGGRAVEDLTDAPAIREPSLIALMDLLVHAIPCAYVGRPQLYPLVTLKAVTFSLVHGNTAVSCRAYATFAALLVSKFDDIDRACEFSEMALRSNERIGRPRDRGSLLMVHAHRVFLWRHSFSNAARLQDLAFSTCLEVGDVAYASYVAALNVWQVFERGDPLDDVLAVSAKYAAFARQAGNEPIHVLIRMEQQFVANLQGRTDDPLSMADSAFDEASNLAVLRKATFGSGIAFYFVMKEMLATLRGRYEEALEAATAGEPFFPTVAALAVEATHHFHHGLALAALASSASTPRREEFARLLAYKGKRFKAWAARCPENFGARSSLLMAEIARVEDRELDAMRLYEDAVRLARAHERVHDEAIALETAARFYEGRGHETIARALLREAREGYRRWRAYDKVRQLERVHPYLRDAGSPVPATATIGASLEELDLATVVRTLQALTSEIVLERWTAKVLTIGLEDAGARRGVLLVADNGDLRCLAEATAGASGVEVRMLEASAALPFMLVRCVERTRETILLDDASASNEFSKDPYIAKGCSRSILCLPLAKQGALRGILYLENELTPCVFTPKRTALLQLLASQAALSLENVWLHSGLQRENDSRRRTEAALRRSEMFLAEAQRLSRTGSFGWSPSTGALHSSDETHRIIGLELGTSLSLEEVFARIHPEDTSQVRDTLRRAGQTGEPLDYEHRFVMPDGSIRFVRVIAKSVHEPGNEVEYVGAVTDITDWHEAEAALQNAQAELAHVMRVSALGELAASIGHEVRQPLGAIAADASAALNWLGFSPPNIDGAREALTAIGADCQRASDILSRINAMLKRAPLERTTCDLNAIVSGVVPLVRSQFERRGVALETELDRELPPLLGDSVQLQQVLINLLLNAVEACRWMEAERRRVVIRTCTESRDGRVWSTASVADAGKGIDPNLRTRIFDAFYTTRPEGLGMGLSISRSIVLRHGGELTVSENQPYGSTFVISLPSLPAPGSHLLPPRPEVHVV